MHPDIKKKYRSEAKSNGLILLTQESPKGYQTYKFNQCGHTQLITPSKVRIGEFKCRDCLEQSRCNIATKRGLDIVGDGNRKSTRVYRFQICGHSQEIGYREVALGSYKCQSCYIDVLKQEARLLGLDILESLPCAKYLYRFIQCGHLVERVPSSLRKQRHVKCDQCIGEQRQSDAEVRGLQLINASNESRNNGIYQFKNCSHKQEISYYNVKIGNFKCRECHNRQLDIEAKMANLNLVGSGENARYRIYICNNCDTRLEIAPTHVRKNSFDCKNCISNRLRDEAESAGLTLTRRAALDSYRVYKFNDCGHEQEINTNAVKKKSFVCNQCEITSRDLPSYVYLLYLHAPTFSWLKLGYTKNLDTRIEQYGLTEDVVVKNLDMLFFQSGRDAHAFELKLHQQFGNKRLPSKKMRDFHRHDGFTECYPTSALDELLTAMSEGR